MDATSSRSRLLGRAAISLALGLAAAGAAGTVGTTAGFDPVGGSFLGLFLGGILSIPPATLIAVFIWFRAEWTELHPLLFVSIGALLTCGAFALMTPDILWAVGPACAVAGLSFVLLSWWARRRAVV